MAPLKQLRVFGELVEILVSSEQTGNTFCVVTQTCGPGGGPPPHIHEYEDEVFTVLEGEFEVLTNDTWKTLAQGETTYSMRGTLHTFRNCGSGMGKIQGVAFTSMKFDEYLEAIAALQMPQDLDRLTEISAKHGIRFVTPEQPVAPPI